MGTRKFASLASANVSATQLASVQTQLDAKASLTGATFVGDLIVRGNLTLTGNTATLDVDRLTLTDPVLTIDVATQPAGLTFAGPNVSLLYQNDVITMPSVRTHTLHATPRVESLTNSKALVSAANGTVTESSVSTTTLVHLANVTSDIQSQLGVLANKSRKSYVVLGTDVAVSTTMANVVQFTPSPFSTYVFTARTYFDASSNVFVSWLLPANTAQFAWAAHGNTAMLVANTAYSQTNASQINVGGVIRTANCSGPVILRANASTPSTLLAPSFITYTKVSTA